ncbi:hypothetical protein [Nonomuraea roseoviolacea]|uniref:Uncharacterized protein n=1 Tax=Nonomuraea roseoviolacea subsp. carminata TaxID=160689 RepID=A0ABT1JTQ1_9ACTN|nr:hypothetical protein [Nonomuraea roseoviolacea]MCP2345133.1 hypothetical protein [Nonomuraea roseoviolacea subsp. carminata]
MIFSSEHRAQIVDGLRALAAFLDSRPDLPLPQGIDVMVSIRHGDDPERQAEIHRIARILGTSIDSDAMSYGHHRATLSFGPVCYQAVAISDASRARWAALMSYQDSILPDPSEGA